MNRLFISIASATVAIAYTIPAPAEQPRTAPPPVQPYPNPYVWQPPIAKPPQPEWYGWKTLIGVGISHTVFLMGFGLSYAGGQGPAAPFMLVGAGGYGLVSPIVHWAHGYVGRGFMSLGLNVAVPGLTLLAATGSGSLEVLVIAPIVTGAVWNVLDAVLLSTEEPAEAKQKRSAFGIHSLAVVPMLEPNRRGLSLVGHF